MKATELRIGNILTNPETGNFSPVTIENISDIENGYLKRVGTLLTEEMLIKLGFKHRNEERGHGSIFDFVTKKDDDWQSRLAGAIMERGYKGSGFYVLNSPTCQALKYVHQLQNLYFALTGEELVIKK